MFESKREHLNSRQEMERNMHIMVELLLTDKIKFSSKTIQSINSLKKVRKLPNGRVNLTTVNELARSMANMAARFDNKEFSEYEKE